MKLDKELLQNWIREIMIDHGLIDDQEILEACGDDERGQKYHSRSSGKFTSPEKEDTCWAWKGCGRSRTKKGSKKRYAISAPQTSGRRPNRTHKCSTNQKIKSEGRGIITRSRLIEIIREELQEVLPKGRRKTDREKRQTLEKARRKKNKEAEKERVAPTHGLQDEVDDMNQWWKTLANGIAEDAELSDKARQDKIYKDAKTKHTKKKELEIFKKKHCKPCPPCKGTTVGDIARNVDALSRALKGKLTDPPKSN